MRFIFLFLSATITVALCFILDTKVVIPAPLGRLLSPQEGVWQNAESVNEDYSADLHFGNLQGKVDVYFDDRLVPHVFAEKENDAYFAQGFLHAKFRLWQMELQVLSASGRASEVVGEIALSHDREFRRLGMVYAAENSLKEMEKDDSIKLACDAYTSGVNAYISTLTKSDLPLEYKLLGYVPEKWNNLKTALFLKYMSFDLSGHENDFEMTNAKNYFTKADFDQLFPIFQDSLDPIIPKGTVFAYPKVIPVVPAFADSIYSNFLHQTTEAAEIVKPDPSNGSNNWAIASSKTRNDAPILCSDPHLGLNLPSLWYEMQISVPGYNAYGVSFPGSPNIIIGFNDSCSFGFTNGGRDVRDYYEVKFKDETKSEYWFDSSWVKTTRRVEKYKIAGKPDFFDTVAYTIFGPVMYDHSFGGKYSLGGKNYAVKWTAHESSNELRLFYLLNRAKNYADYLVATKHLKTPGQNCVFACKNGDIAIRTQGYFPAKWKGQGDFVMPGYDSAYLWQGMIPEDETPFEFNPSRAFVSSANQRPVDSTYPYYLGREYPLARGAFLNKSLATMQDVTVQNMMDLQLSTVDYFASMAVPVLLKNINQQLLNNEEMVFYKKLQEWNYCDEANSVAPTLYYITWKSLTDTVFNDEYAKAPKYSQRPLESTLLEAVLRDSSYKFIDNITTNKKESLQDVCIASFKYAASICSKLQKENMLLWGNYKDTKVSHLLRLPMFSKMNLFVGGGENAINAMKNDHGPSWRMIVSLTKITEAYGIYPGGQSGNPGSKFYDNSILDWAAGKYYKLWLMTQSEKQDSRIKWQMHFSTI